MVLEQKMNTKLHIDLSRGVIDVKGDSELVREIYSDFKEQLLSFTSTTLSPEQNAQNAAEINSSNKTKPTRRSNAKRKKRANDQEVQAGIQADSPKLDKNIDTSGLVEYFTKFEPKNHSEKILIFLKYLIEELEIDVPNTDQIFTCYEKTNVRIPKVFSQAFRGASNKFGFIDYKSPVDIRLTTAGINHFKHDIKMRAAAE